MSRLRVAYVAHSVDPRRGGMELVSARLLERIASDVELEVVAGDGLATLPAGVRRTRVPIPGGPSIARLVCFDVIGSLRLRGVRRRVDLVHCNGAVAHCRADVVTMHLSHAALMEAQGGATPPGRKGVRGVVGAWRRILAARLERWLLGGHVGTVLAVSTADAGVLRARYPSLDVRVVENGVDLGRFAHVAQRGVEASTPLRVVVVAGDFERKRVSLAIEAIARTRRCTLTVVGGGDLAAMRQLAADLGTGDRVVLRGHLDDVVDELAVADVVLSCSLYESFGLSMVEGAASGCAVVCTDTGIGPELVGGDDGEVAGVVVRGDAAAIAQVLDELDEDRARCVAMGEVARGRAMRFTWDEMAKATLAVYAAIASAR